MGLVGRIEMVSVSVNIKQKGQFMIAQLFKRRVCSESLMHQVGQGLVGLIATFFMVAGVLKVTAMELTEPQMLLGFGVVFTLVLQCGIIAMLIEFARKRKAA